jgi:hypothetical protein
MINREQFTGSLRILVPAVCAWLAAQGFKEFSDSTIVTDITVAIITIGSVLWSFVAHTDASKIESVASIDPMIRISIPEHVLKNDTSVEAIVKDITVPNVVKNEHTNG